MKNSFLKSVIIRGIWTFCETMLALIGTFTFIEEISWKAVLSASLMALIISILKSIVTGLPEVNQDTFYNINELYEKTQNGIYVTTHSKDENLPEVNPEYYNIELPDRKEK